MMKKSFFKGLLSGSMGAISGNQKDYWRPRPDTDADTLVSQIDLRVTTHPMLDVSALPHYSSTKGGPLMPKYLIQARYTNQGVQGLLKDSASGRRADVQAAVKALGGSVEAFYYAFGEDDAIVIIDLPNSTKAAALSLSVSGAGAVRVRTTPLLTVEEIDQALEIHTQYRAPGE
jgi:uncharacterized protein with GYD domain